MAPLLNCKEGSLANQASSTLPAMAAMPYICHKPQALFFKGVVGCGNCHSSSLIENSLLTPRANHCPSSLRRSLPRCLFTLSSSFTQGELTGLLIPCPPHWNAAKFHTKLFCLQNTIYRIHDGQTKISYVEF